MSEQANLTCPSCGAPPDAEGAFCDSCGASLAGAGKPPPAAEAGDGGPLLAWEVGVPMVNNPFFLWDMAKLWGLACLFLFLVFGGIWLVQGSEASRHFVFLVPFWSFVGFYVFSLLIAVVFFLNRFYAHVVFDDGGVRYELARWSGKLGKAVSSGNIVLGALTGSATAAGIGLIGQAQRSVVLPWRAVRKVTCFPRYRAITLSNSWRPVVRLRFPDDELFDQARQIIEREVPAAGGSLQR